MRRGVEEVVPLKVRVEEVVPLKVRVEEVVQLQSVTSCCLTLKCQLKVGKDIWWSGARQYFISILCYIYRVCFYIRIFILLSLGVIIFLSVLSILVLMVDAISMMLDILRFENLKRRDHNTQLPNYINQ